ncbi:MULTISPECIES: 50S ribosomal protein L11 methyltransferase [unclassified Virgibacillus]|uniref:50S ribosomal protein L11 methyltransferase n=1 Tax=unclassified Virgibacillus TaxID=2620237 RepID=UPI0024DE054E|nr:50S ribosomal protein L11 methyltransferase [Virgibacillus sp. LDC-1]
MKWSEICIHTTNEAVEPISNILHEFGAAGVVIEDPIDLMIDRVPLYGEIFELDASDYPDEGVYVKAYFPINEQLTEKVDDLRQSIDRLRHYDIKLGKNHIIQSEVQEEDWETAWKKYYKPVRVSDHITIAPTWENYQPSNDDEILIELDPGMAFGTGTHPTTILSLRALESFIRKGDVVIDVGCGSGILSIASAALGANKVYAYDLDDVAIKSTRLNMETNKQEAKIEVQQNNLLQNVAIQANVIVSNILAEIIVQFVEDAWKNLKDDGLFITSGIIQAKKEMVLNKLKDSGFSIVESNEMEDWVSIVAKKDKK